MERNVGQDVGIPEAAKLTEEENCEPRLPRLYTSFHQGVRTYSGHTGHEQYLKMPENKKIREAAVSVRTLLRECLASLDIEHNEWAEDFLADFNLWAAGAGACAPGKASLDYRLHQNLNVQEVITNILYMLRILIARLQTKGKLQRKKSPKIMRR